MRLSMTFRWLAFYHCDTCNSTWKVSYGYGLSIEDMTDFCENCLKNADYQEMQFADPHFVERKRIND